jgi:hypothetical protein
MLIHRQKSSTQKKDSRTEDRLANRQGENYMNRKVAGSFLLTATFIVLAHQRLRIMVPECRMTSRKRTR